ncbi:MAG: efflux RND transporter periplasmic adaptor subunit [bacterium]|nr:MAG: efflux RND transporter periplasmic adaptor subunit [bacterium]
MQRKFTNFAKIGIFTLSQRIVISLVALFAACSGDSGSTENMPGPAIPAVEAVQARFGSLPLTQRLSGIVEAENQVEIYPEISAIVEAVFVKDGDPVKKGDPLLRLRDKEFKERMKQASAGFQIAIAQQKQAEARLNEIKSELRRTEALSKQGLASPTELETVQTRAIAAEADVELAKARLEQAEATVEERKETLSQTIIRSPIHGTVGNRNAEVGMLVTGNTRLFTLGQLENIRVNVILTDRMLNYIQEGQRTEILSEYSERGIIQAKLSRISPFLNPVSHSTEAEIDLNNPGGELKPGMFVTVDVFYGESEQAILIPLSGLFENPATGVTGVYVTRAKFNQELVLGSTTDPALSLSEPVDFEFKAVEVLAKGRMEAGIRGIEEDQWVVTLGQNLLGGEAGKARVRPVKWAWVERLQYLQREDLMESLFLQQGTTGDSTLIIP